MFADHCHFVLPTCLVTSFMTQKQHIGVIFNNFIIKQHTQILYLKMYKIMVVHGYFYYLDKYYIKVL